MSDLQYLLDKQRELQLIITGKDPSELEGIERIVFIKDMTLALFMELGEMLDETGWKPWATSRHVNEEPAQREGVDVLFFLLNLMLVMRMTDGFAWMKMYDEKWQINADRARSKTYDGISGKCPGCKRALDDVAVQCHYSSSPLRVGEVWCQDRLSFFKTGA